MVKLAPSVAFSEVYTSRSFRVNTPLGCRRRAAMLKPRREHAAASRVGLDRDVGPGESFTEGPGSSEDVGDPVGRRSGFPLPLVTGSRYSWKFSPRRGRPSSEIPRA